MENALLAAVIAILAAVGVGFTVRHFRGQGGCCGGGGYRPRRKKLDHVIAQKTFRVEGMHCQHCKNRVEEAVGDISGAAARVNLKKAWSPSSTPGRSTIRPSGRKSRRRATP